jgi:hypothetical protein
MQSNPNFSKSSRKIGISQSTLYAECQKSNGSWVESGLDLNEYLGNDNGQFQWGGKDFSKSARNLKMEGKGVLTGELQRVDGSWNKTTIDLDKHISNNDGKLVR